MNMAARILARSLTAHLPDDFQSEVSKVVRE
jgi:hypothetical protein